MPVSFKIQHTFPVNAAKLYAAWLNSESHSAMTGGEAICSSEVGGTFSAWNEYIRGTNLSLTENSEIIQSWRTSEFKDDDEDSRIHISLVDGPEGCELTLIHENIPDGQPDYALGWQEHYFAPMMDFFTQD